MTKLTNEEAVAKLAEMYRNLADSINETRNFAIKHKLPFTFNYDETSEYRELDSWEAEELGMNEGDLYWVSSSTFC